MEIGQANDRVPNYANKSCYPYEVRQVILGWLTLFMIMVARVSASLTLSQKRARGLD